MGIVYIWFFLTINESDIDQINNIRLLFKFTFRGNSGQIHLLPPSSKLVNNLHPSPPLFALQPLNKFCPPTCGKKSNFPLNLWGLLWEGPYHKEGGGPYYEDVLLFKKVATEFYINICYALCQIYT